MMKDELTVILPIYYHTDVLQFMEAFRSILSQTRLPEEIFIVSDGPVSPELNETIEDAKCLIEQNKQAIAFTVYRLPEHAGLGEALRQASLFAKGKYVARMDSDDICMPDRFEKQMKCFERNPQLSVVGGQIAEFDGEVTNVTGRRQVPLQHDDIAAYMRSRNAMNHVTTIMKREDLLAAGNYQPLNWLEDYYLWVRMIQQGFLFQNVPDDVVLVRAGKAQTDRRGGWDYFYYEHKLFRYMRSQHFISWWRYVMNLVERGCVRLLLPLSMRHWFYRFFLR